MSKHTPGPWIARPASVDTGMEGYVFVYCPKDYLICGPVNNRPDGLDNARLIAAAPELLEAAQAMLAVCYDLERNDETLAAVKKTMKAVFKATGERS